MLMKWLQPTIKQRVKYIVTDTIGQSAVIEKRKFIESRLPGSSRSELNDALNGLINECVEHAYTKGIQDGLKLSRCPL